MRALQITAPGAPLAAVDLAEPVPGPGEVLVAIEAAGMCRSDVHYRAGTRPVPSLPLVPGHEIAGTIVGAGEDVSDRSLGDRVALHYLVTCGECEFCLRGAEQFCTTGEMLGLDRQGGYAEQIVVPAGNTHLVPEGVSTRAAAVMMCSTATSLHALRRGRVGPGSAVALIGAGGLGMSAIQIATVLGADPVFAIDIDPDKLRAAADLGAIAVDGRDDAVRKILQAGGADVAVELVGSSALMADAVRMLRPQGRAVAVGITHTEFGLDPYRDLVRREAEILGTADHLPSEIEEVLAWEADGSIDIDGLITRTIPLEQEVVEGALVALERFGGGIRTVIEP
jgi:propanol-preferring alcohol dehydrogenase